MYFKIEKMFCLVIFISIISATVAQSPLGDRPSECETDRNFCMNFCLTTNKDTIWAQCGKDKISCICTDQFHRSVKVRFIEERMPVPPTTPTTPTPVQYVNSEPVNPLYTPVDQHHQQSPQLLRCDASEHATILCNTFCTLNTGAFRGLCNITDFTCLCQGVSPAVVQEVPITAIFNGPLPPPPTTPRPPPPKNFWTPITPSHPNYNPNSISNGHYQSYPQTQPQQQQQQQQQQQVYQQYSPYRPPEPHFVPSAYGHPVHTQNNLHTNPQEQIVGQGITMTQSVSEHIETPDTEENTPEVKEQKESLPEISEHHRKRRSAGSSYANILSFGSSGHQGQTKYRTCSIYSCEDACTKNQFNLPSCVAKCLENECVCICKPSDYDVMIDEINMQGSGEGSSPRPFMFPAGNFQSMKPFVPQQENNVDKFTPPPALY